MLGRGAVHLGSLAWSFGVIALVLRAAPVGSRQPGQTPPPAAQPLDLAIAILRSSERFTSAGIGYAGLTPNEVLAWRVVFHSPDADSIFQNLLGNASVAGQLYALAGLRFNDSNAFAKAAARLRARAGRVQTIRGCIVGSLTVAEAVREIERGDWTREFIAGRLIPALPQ